MEMVVSKLEENIEMISSKTKVGSSLMVISVIVAIMILIIGVILL